jgi:hypothetical protein
MSFGDEAHCWSIPGGGIIVWGGESDGKPTVTVFSIDGTLLSFCSYSPSFSSSLSPFSILPSPFSALNVFYALGCSLLVSPSLRGDITSSKV